MSEPDSGWQCHSQSVIIRDGVSTRAAGWDGARTDHRYPHLLPVSRHLGTITTKQTQNCEHESKGKLDIDNITYIYIYVSGQRTKQKQQNDPSY